MHSHSFADSCKVNTPRFWATDKNAIIKLRAELMPSTGRSTSNALGFSVAEEDGMLSELDDMVLLYIDRPLYIGES